ncbi:hypothetical protein Cni_G06942 [Canna indica]|uniref:Uncharacterized protein n=1 Tax=Canna indica TaxID=4628 RepID=A0AAQ3JY30_9LILI|nr:hypothetical protein Cni_G06942 [Canna indica]
MKLLINQRRQLNHLKLKMPLRVLQRKREHEVILAWLKCGIPPGNHIVVRLGKKKQPVGQAAGILGDFLGTIARNPEMAPINLRWKDIPDALKEMMLEVVEAKFSYPCSPTMTKWVLRSINSKWRNWKSNSRAVHYDSSKSLSYHLSHVSERVDKNQWSALVSFWNSEEGQKTCKMNQINRSKQKMPHTLGKKSYASVIDEIETKTGQPMSRDEIFIITHERKKDKMPVDEEAARAIATMKDIRETYPELAAADVPIQEDIFSKVLGPENSGYVRCFGIDPSPTDFATQCWGSVEIEKEKEKRSTNSSIN